MMKDKEKSNKILKFQIPAGKYYVGKNLKNYNQDEAPLFDEGAIKKQIKFLEQVNKVFCQEMAEKYPNDAELGRAIRNKLKK